MRCARKLSEERGSTVRLYKNNTDFRGHSYGCHENYLLPRSLSWEKLAAGIQAFLVTRQIIAARENLPSRRKTNSFRPASRFRNAATFSANCKAWTPCSAGPLSTHGMNRTPTPIFPPLSRHTGRRQHVAVFDAPEDWHDRAGPGSAGPKSQTFLPRAGRPAEGSEGHFPRPEIPLGSGLAG